MTYTVTTRGIRKSYGGHVVLDGVDLAVETGTVYALLGPNGAGKTTMVSILSTLTRPDGGNAMVAGHDLHGDPDGVRRSISLTGQYAAVDEVLTAEENLQMMARLLHLSRRQARSRTEELLTRFDLLAARDKRVKTFSGGMRRRLDLAISLISRPTLVFLDDPTTGLDPRSREQVWSTVRGLVADGTTIFLTTQYLEEADRLADQIAMLDHGRIVAEGTADELKSSLAGEVARLEFADDTTFAYAVASLGRPACDESGDRAVEVPTDGTAEHVRELLARLADAGAPVQRLSLHRPSLDDVFLSLTSQTATTLTTSKETVR
ncbi:MAG: ATP-binding cassette domain-containing protein [Nocardioidaceae bacterium]